MKNKTLATWLTFFGGPLGLHRFYLRGLGDLWGWLLPLPTALGLYGIDRVMQYGQDDPMSWWLIPLLGFNIAANGLNAIVYGLMSREKWNGLYNPGAAPDALAGRTTWLTIGGVAVALMVGTTILMSSIAFSFQRYFEYQIQEAMKISQYAGGDTPTSSSGLLRGSTSMTWLPDQVGHDIQWMAPQNSCRLTQ